MDLSDKDLLYEIGQKNEGAFNIFYCRYWQLIYNFVYSRTNKKIITEEITQILWSNIWLEPQKIKTDEEGSAKRFLLAFVIFKILNYLKSREAGISNFIPLDDLKENVPYSHIDEEIDAKEVLLAINQILHDLPRTLQNIYLLRQRYNYSVKETARMLSLKESTVRAKLSSALSIIRLSLSKVPDYKDLRKNELKSVKK